MPRRCATRASTPQGPSARAAAAREPEQAARAQAREAWGLHAAAVFATGLPPGVPGGAGDHDAVGTPARPPGSPGGPAVLHDHADGDRHAPRRVMTPGEGRRSRVGVARIVAASAGMRRTGAGDSVGGA